MKPAIKFLLWLALLMVQPVWAQKRVVRHPVFSYTADDGLVPQLIVADENRTTIAFRCLSKKAWKLAPTTCLQTDDGHVYKAIGGRVFVRYLDSKSIARTEKLTFDDNFYVGWHIDPQHRLSYASDSVVIDFEPLPAHCQTFSFTEQPGSDEGWAVGHIRFDGHAPLSLLPSQNTCQDNVPNEGHEHKYAQIKVQLLGEMSGNIKNNLDQSITISSKLASEQVNFTQNVDSTHHEVLFTLMLTTAKNLYVHIGNNVIPISVVPGEELKVLVDMPSLTLQKYVPGYQHRSAVRMFKKYCCSVKKQISKPIAKKTFKHPLNPQ